jgi:c(7)-type cytochrome triheme protein
MKLRWITVTLLLLAMPTLTLARWIKDEVILKSDATGKVVFSHYNHLDAVGHNCPTCHNKIFNIVPEKNPAFTMADMEKGQACGACHNGERAFSVKENCATCHPTHDITFPVPDAGKVVFSHEVHTGMYSCSECHPGLFLPGEGNRHFTMEEMAGGEACGACHDGSTAFTVEDNCDSCHQM